jgi:hypothetical protein
MLQQRHVRRLKSFIAAAAICLLAGVSMWCHAQLRTSAWIVSAQAKAPPTDSPSDEEIKEAERWFSLIASIGREERFARNLLVPIGAGTLVGSLLALAVAKQLRFTVRTLCFPTLYCALLIGIPFGCVRPWLQNPRIWLKETNLAFGQIRQWSGGESQKTSDDPWARPGPNSKSEAPLVDLNCVFLAVAASIALPLLAFVPYPSNKTTTCPLQRAE